jgi:hypothetical protein
MLSVRVTYVEAFASIYVVLEENCLEMENMEKSFIVEAQKQLPYQDVGFGEKCIAFVGGSYYR